MPGPFTHVHHLGELQVSLTYLSIDIGVALGDFVNGKFLGINYQRTATDFGITVNKVTHW